jgi:TonB family protein
VEAPAKSSVSLAPSPALPQFVVPAEIAPRPTVSIALHLPGNFRPKGVMQTADTHVYQRFEVDQVGRLLYETAPRVAREAMNGASVLRVTLIWIVEPDGTVSNVRIGTSSGNAKVDELMADMVREAVFTPAMKGGRKVRMMTSQQITVRWSGDSGLPRFI